MKKIILLLSICLMFFSCKKDKDAEQKSSISLIEQSDRLVFTDYDEFLTTYSKLAKHQTEDELRSWAKTKNHSTLLDTQDTTLQKYSSVLRTILNKDQEFELGNSIVWLNDGKFLGYPKDGIKPNKENEGELNLIATVSLFKTNIDSKGTLVGANTLHAKWQNEFTVTRYAPCGGPIEDPISGMRKYVSELVHEALYYPAFEQWNSTLYLRIKLEERTPRINWRTCWNQREVIYYVYGTAAYKFGTWVAGTTSFNKSYSYTACNYISGPLTIFLTSNSHAPRPNPAPDFDVDLDGYITQHILGDNTTITIPSPAPGGDLW